MNWIEIIVLLVLAIFDDKVMLFIMLIAFKVYSGRHIETTPRTKVIERAVFFKFLSPKDFEKS